MSRRLAGWPLRVRLTIAFAAVMAVVLTTVGGVVYLRLASSLDATITLALHSRADDVALLARQRGGELSAAGRSTLTERGESIAQVTTTGGVVVDATPGLRARPLLSAGELARTARGPILLSRRSTPAGDDPVRLFALRTTTPTGTVVVVVGASVEDRHDALSGLLGLFLIGGPIALLLASAAGYALAAAALRPVDQMRREAETIQASTPGERLAVPPADDEIGRLGHTFNDLLGRLEAAVEQERSFVSDASHELRTPLAILQAELEFALRPVRTDGERSAALVSAAAETDRLVRLAEDLLVLARAGEDGLPLKADRVEVGELVTTVAARFARAATEAGVVLSVVAPDAGAVVGDRLRLEQALGNLVENALGHGAHAVTLEARAEAGYVVLAVLDDGDGFDEAILPRAFDRFTRGDPARSRGGTGLGLAIVAAVAKAHGGSVRAGNRTPAGAAVWLSVRRGAAAGLR